MGVDVKKVYNKLIIEGMQAGKGAGAVGSFDLNYRAKLWIILGGHERAVAVLDRIVRNVDVLVGNEEDLQMGLGIPGPEVASKSKLDPSAFVGMIDQVTKKHPQIKVLATTLREVHSTNRHSWSAVAWINGKSYVAPTCELDVCDRVGGGDGFAAGLFYGLMNGDSEEEAVKLGWAHGALLTTFSGEPISLHSIPSMTRRWKTTGGGSIARTSFVSGVVPVA